MLKIRQEKNLVKNLREKRSLYGMSAESLQEESIWSNCIYI